MARLTDTLKLYLKKKKKEKTASRLLHSNIKVEWTLFFLLKVTFCLILGHEICSYYQVFTICHASSLIMCSWQYKYPWLLFNKHKVEKKHPSLKRSMTKRKVSEVACLASWKIMTYIGYLLFHWGVHYEYYLCNETVWMTQSYRSLLCALKSS